MTITITKQLGFDAGHRLINHEGKCRHVHGHRYTAHITVGANVLDEVGRIVDFSVIKEKVGGWIDDQWDHGYIAHVDDPIGQFAVAAGLKVFWIEENPTAEVLSAVLYRQAVRLLRQSGLKVISVTLFETPTSSATYAG